MTKIWQLIQIEEKNPLKQGLKHHDSNIILGRTSDWREESIKTRIETFTQAVALRPCFIEEKNPLKQGLKHQKTSSIAGWAIIEEKNPLKQGLKLTILIGNTNMIPYWREESIKTRIETSSAAYTWIQCWILKRRIH